VVKTYDVYLEDLPADLDNTVIVAISDMHLGMLIDSEWLDARVTQINAQKPDIVVETGVASGVSSSYILCAMEENRHGQLYSIDQPWWKEEQSGWMIPDYLRHRWHLVPGKSSERLLPVLKEVAEIDIFLHDSDHSYRNMLREFQTAWTYLKAGGLLLSHNIDTNNAFSDFCRERGVKGYTLTIMGGVMKPWR